MRLSDLSDTTADAVRSAGAFVTDLMTPEPPAGRHGLCALGQNRLHHRPGAQPRCRWAPAVLRSHGAMGASRAPTSSLSPTTSSRALPTKSTWPARQRPAAVAREHPAHQPAARHHRIHACQRRCARLVETARLHVDIVDYPGEWLIDLPLLELSFAAWSRRAVAAARAPQPRGGRRAWLAYRPPLAADRPPTSRSRCAALSFHAAYLAGGPRAPTPRASRRGRAASCCRAILPARRS